MNEFEYVPNPESESRPDEMFMGSGDNWEFNSHGVTFDMKDIDNVEFHFEPYNSSAQMENKAGAISLITAGIDDFIQGSEVRFNEEDLLAPTDINVLTNEMLKRNLVHWGFNFKEEPVINQKGEKMYQGKVSFSELHKNNQRMRENGLVDRARKGVKQMSL